MQRKGLLISAVVIVLLILAFFVMKLFVKDKQEAFVENTEIIKEEDTELISEEVMNPGVVNGSASEEWVENHIFQNIDMSTLTQDTVELHADAVSVNTDDHTTTNLIEHGNTNVYTIMNYINNFCEENSINSYVVNSYYYGDENSVQQIGIITDVGEHYYFWTVKMDDNADEELTVYYRKSEVYE